MKIQAITNILTSEQRITLTCCKMGWLPDDGQMESVIVTETVT